MPQYNPNQPRVPKGHSNGGEWTREGVGSYQPIYFAPARELKNVAPSEVQRAFVPPPPAYPIAKAIELALLLLTMQAARSDPGTQRVGVYRADESSAAGEPKFELKLLTDKEVQASCPYHKEVIAKTNKAASDVNDEIRKNRERVSPAVYGTRVHHKLATAIEEENPNYVAVEASVAKAKLETETSDREAREHAANHNWYGKKGTVRYDVLEWGVNDTLCIMDVKNGEREFAEATMKKYAEFAVERAAELKRYIAKMGTPKKVFLVQVKPAVPRPRAR